MFLSALLGAFYVTVTDVIGMLPFFDPLKSDSFFLLVFFLILYKGAMQGKLGLDYFLAIEVFT